MKDLVKKLLDIWYACLIDHHKDRDCHFYVQQKFSAYGQGSWVVYHNGYLYSWECTEESYEKCIATLSNQLKEMIEQECLSYMEQEGNSTWQSFSDKQIQTMKDNYSALQELLASEEV